MSGLAFCKHWSYSSKSSTYHQTPSWVSKTKQKITLSNYLLKFLDALRTCRYHVTQSLGRISLRTKTQDILLSQLLTSFSRGRSDCHRPAAAAPAEVAETQKGCCHPQTAAAAAVAAGQNSSPARFALDTAWAPAHPSAAD